MSQHWWISFFRVWNCFHKKLRKNYSIFLMIESFWEIFQFKIYAFFSFLVAKWTNFVFFFVGGGPFHEIWKSINDSESPLRDLTLIRELFSTFIFFLSFYSRSKYKLQRTDIVHHIFFYIFVEAWRQTNNISQHIVVNI